jgi:hypothetical protein
VIFSAEEDFDFIFIECEASPEVGFVTLASDVQVGEVLMILQHPRGRPLALSFGAVLSYEDEIIRYKASTDVGSSGLHSYGKRGSASSRTRSGDQRLHE